MSVLLQARHNLAQELQAAQGAAPVVVLEIPGVAADHPALERLARGDLDRKSVV